MEVVRRKPGMIGRFLPRNSWRIHIATGRPESLVAIRLLGTLDGHHLATRPKELAKTGQVCSECVLWNRDTAVNSRDVIKELKKDGWYLVHQAGSHKQFKHPVKAGRVTVPHPKRDIPLGTLKSIEKQAGIRLR